MHTQFRFSSVVLLSSLLFPVPVLSNPSPHAASTRGMPPGRTVLFEGSMNTAPEALDEWIRSRAGRIVNRPVSGTLTLTARHGALWSDIAAQEVDLPETESVRVPPDGLLVFVVETDRPTLLSGHLVLTPEDDLRPGLRATVLCNTTVIAAPMIEAVSPWQGEGDGPTAALTGTLPDIPGRAPDSRVEITPVRIPAGRHILSIAGPHFRGAGTFHRMELAVTETDGEPPLWSFALLSDIHLGSGRRLWMNIMLSGPGGRELPHTLGQLEREGVQTVFLAGDMTDQGRREQYEALASIVDNVSLEIYGNIGNHDCAEEHSRRHALTLTPNLFPNGQTQYVVSKPPVRFLVLDGSHYRTHDGGLLDYRDRERTTGPAGTFTPDEIDWIRAALNEDVDTPTVVIWHYPMSARATPASSGYLMRGIRYAPHVRQLLEDAPNVIAVLCGHTHHNEANIENGVAHLVNPAYAEWPNAYRVFRVYPDRIEWELRQVANRGFIRESFDADKAMSWMLSTDGQDLGGVLPLAR